jgi:hypothetical protein
MTIPMRPRKRRARRWDQVEDGPEVDGSEVVVTSRRKRTVDHEWRKRIK